MIKRDDLPRYEEAMKNVIEDTAYVPGVRYLCFAVKDRSLPFEVYAVDRSSPAISDEAKRYGIPFPDRSDVLVYDCTDPDSGKGIVEYEMHRYLHNNSAGAPRGLLRLFSVNLMVSHSVSCRPTRFISWISSNRMRLVRSATFNPLVLADKTELLS